MVLSTAWYPVLMRVSFFSFLTALLLLSYTPCVSAQMGAQLFTENLSLGSSGAQVTALQRVLNQDPDTRVAATGPGSLGQETNYFGQLTKAAVVRFQEKHSSEILTPAELTKGTGRVGSYTRAKLNVLSTLAAATKSTSSAATTATSAANGVPTEYLVKENEKVDIYVGDKMIANIRKRLFNAIDAAIISGSTATVTPPTIRPGDMPSIAIGIPVPQIGTPGTYISLKGTGITSASVIYFGNDYIVRKVSESPGDTFIFKVPPIPSGRYDIAMRAGGTISNTVAFVVRDPKNPPVHIESVSPATVSYGGTLTITGSGFTPQGNVVVTTSQKFTNVPSTDGKTLTVQLAPESLKEYAKVAGGEVTMPMSVYVENDYGFSDSEKSFILSL